MQFFLSAWQSAFSVLDVPEIANGRELAGAVVNRNLTIVNLSGLIIGAILILTSFWGTKNLSRIGAWTERVLLILMTAACAVGQFVIITWMSFIRSQLGKPLVEVAADDPLLIKFNQLHQYSQWVLLTAMITALLAFFVISLKSDTNVTETK
ncbi:MAG TPA: hypothetical protein PKE69_12455 [Pyrinomonadaceae bacterium]|nr:hypothetical protein [Pyrinomonadaceae bacterium]